MSRADYDLYRALQDTKSPAAEAEATVCANILAEFKKVLEFAKEYRTRDAAVHRARVSMTHEAFKSIQSSDDAQRALRGITNAFAPYNGRIWDPKVFVTVDHADCTLCIELSAYVQ
jgi:hypothetical protein